MTRHSILRHVPILPNEADIDTLQVVEEDITARGGKYAASGNFLIPLCVNNQQATRIFSALHFGAKVLYPENYHEVLNPYWQAMENIQEGQICDTGDFPEEHDCRDFSPNSYILTYAPNDPFQTPNLTPDGYQAPPWRTFEEGDIPLTLTGLIVGDAIASRWAFEPNDWWEFVVPFAYFVENFLSLPDLVSSGFPRFKVHVQGEGTVELHLLAIPYGGDALIIVDGEPNSQTKLVNLATFTLGSFVDLNEIVDAVMGFVFTDADAVQETILEVELSGDTAHTIEVILLPHIDLGGDFGFGGGLRKVVLCKENLIGVENQMPQFDLENEVLRWKPNPDASWENLGQVIYKPSMREQSGEIQWTLQNLPIGGGLDATADWIPLLTPEAGQGIDSVEIEVLEHHFDTPTASLEEGVLTLGLPPAKGIEDVHLSVIPRDGSGGEQGATITGEVLYLKVYNPLEAVEVSAVLYNDDPTASLEEGVLTLGIPVGRGITEVTFSLTEHGTEPTADLLGETLLLTIPAPLDGQDGEDGEDGQTPENGQDGQDGQGIDSVSITLTAHGTTPTATLTGGALALTIPAPLDGQDGQDAQPCDCDESQTVPTGDGQHEESYQCGKALGLVDYTLTVIQQVKTVMELDNPFAIAINSLVTIESLNRNKIAAMYTALTETDWETVDEQISNNLKDELYQAYYCALDDTDTLSNEGVDALKSLSGLEPELQAVYDVVFDAMLYSDIRYHAWIFAHIGGDCAEFGCGECQVWDFSEYSSLPSVLSFSQNGLNNLGSFDANTGIVSPTDSDFDAHFYRIRVGIQLPLDAQLTSIQIDMYAEGSTGQYAWEVIDKDYTHLHFDNYAPGLPNPKIINLSRTGDNNYLGIIGTFGYNNAPGHSAPNGSPVIWTKITLCFANANPFAE